MDYWNNYNINYQPSLNMEYKKLFKKAVKIELIEKDYFIKNHPEASYKHILIFTFKKGSTFEYKIYDQYYLHTTFKPMLDYIFENAKKRRK